MIKRKFIIKDKTEDHFDKKEQNDFNKILREGNLIDNSRANSLNMNDAIKIISEDSEGLKCAVGYFYIEGLIQIIYSLKNVKEIKILMGYETNRPTKEELIKIFKEKINNLDENEQTNPAIKLFYQLVKDYKNLKIRVYFGNENSPERLHSKAYLFLRDIETKDMINRYKVGIIGSSNLTPSGLIGNTELNVIITEPKELEYLEKWFNNLWDKGTEDFEKLKISEAIVNAIETSKFKEELNNTFFYMEAKEFIIVLIKYLNADYLFEDFEKSNLLKFQYIDFIRILNNFNSKGYRGCLLTSSVGLGKSYVAAQVAKYFLNNDKKVIIIAPAGLVKNNDQWQKYLKEFKIYDKIDLVSMGDLQKNPEYFDINKYTKNYGIIIVDEVHNYRNPDTYRTRNLKKIIDENGESKILFLTATPINTRLDDLLNLIKLFYRKGSNLLFDNLVRELEDIINLLKIKEFENLTNKEKGDLYKVQEEIEKEMFVKSTRETIKTDPDYINELKSFTKVDITKLKDPKITEIKYELDQNYKDTVKEIVNFITSLTAAHLRLLDPEKGIRLGGFFKWILYKRFESDISAYYLTLKRLYKKSTMILNAVENKDTKYLKEDEYEDDTNINFNLDFEDKLKGIIEDIELSGPSKYSNILKDLKSDINNIKKQIEKLEPFIKENSKLLFKNDQKLNKLYSIVKSNNNKKILIFTEYKDTLNSIKEYFKDLIKPEEIKFVDSDTKNKQAIIENFNNKENKLKILISTDTLSEGFNISSTDLLINFDIPYNPIRLIQRIGRATRLDNPKEIEVLNFRPDDSIDIELKLVEKLELRIKDIIRFIGIEYRIWFETEKRLLSERREFDKRIYIEILEKIRNDYREGNFNKLEVNLSYSKPILLFLQKAISKYKIKREEIKEAKIPKDKVYTLFNGKKDLSIIYKDTDSFNEETLLNKEIEENFKKIDFEKTFKFELNKFYKFKEDYTKKELVMEYFNDNLDKKINSILDYISKEKLSELFPEEISKLNSNLENIKIKCGSNTEKVVKEIKNQINKSNISRQKINNWNNLLEKSFTKRLYEPKLIPKEEHLFAIGFIENYGS